MKKNQLFYIFLFTAVFGLFFSVHQVFAVTGSINIENGKSSVKSRQVNLYLTGPSMVRKMIISNDIDFSTGSWENFQSSKVWWLDYGGGTKTVYVKFEDVYGNKSPVYKDTIYLDVPTQMSVDFTINGGDKETVGRYVDLEFTWSSGVEGFRVSNTNNFSSADFIAITSGIVWPLPSGSGDKEIFVEFKDANEKTTVVSHKIYYRQPDRVIAEGSLLKGQTSTVYYLGFDGKIHPFASASIYHSWYKDYSNIIYMSNAKLGQFQIGKPVCVRAGTWLLKFKSSPRIYAVEPGCMLKPLLSEAEAYIIYGGNWSKRVIELDQIYSSNYFVRNYDASDPTNDVYDRDKDGVPSYEENKNGSSDGSFDTDNDGLSDYEEIYFWFSDPAMSDTDGNGVKDGKEILRGKSPVGGQNLSIPDGTYKYPNGVIVKRVADKKYYYKNYLGEYIYVASKLNDKNFTSDNFDSAFIIESPAEIRFSPKAKAKTAQKEANIFYPTASKNGFIYQL